MSSGVADARVIPFHPSDVVLQISIERESTIEVASDMFSTARDPPWTMEHDATVKLVRDVAGSRKIRVPAARHIVVLMLMVILLLPCKAMAVNFVKVKFERATVIKTAVVYGRD